MSDKAAQAWAGLNARQQLYLTTIFAFDQEAEAAMKARSAKWLKTPPASEWRQVTYDVKVPKKLTRKITGYSSVQDKLREEGQHDPGSGVTLKALRTRGLLTVSYDRVEVLLGVWADRTRVRLTTLGRAAARAGKGITTPATTPTGLMARWSFAALARLYVAGNAGLPLYGRDRDGKRVPSWNTLLNLRDRKNGSFIDEYTAANDYGGWDNRVRLTPIARRHYEIHHGCYRELYPDVDAPAPAEPAAHAHTGLASHRVRRPRHLVRDTDLPVLARLTELEAQGACYARHNLIEYYERRREPVPDDVHTIPSGLLRWQVANLTLTEKSIDRLAAHSGGPLVEVVDAPNLPLYVHQYPTLPLVVLTDLGREHFVRYLDEYRSFYPDLPLPAAE
jgi:hypothetical protein